MSIARITIEADTSGIAAAFARLRADAKATENTIAGSLGRASTRAAGAYRTNGRAMRDELDKTAAAAERDAHRSVAAYIRSEEQKRRAATQTARVRTSLEQAATAVAREEARKRGLSAEGEARVRQNALERLTRQHEANERRQTAVTQREARERASRGRAIGQGVAAVGRGGMQAAQQAHGVIQDARERRAGAEHTINAALFQAGIGGREATGMQARLQREVATGSLRGLSLAQVSEGLLGAQTQFSVLTGDDAQRREWRSRGITDEQGREENFNQQVSLASFARDTFQDPGEVMRVAGMLGQQGVRGADQRQALLALTGMAQAGSLELSGVTSTALGPLMQNIARSTNANMTAQQRAAAVRAAASETMAVGEIGGAAGLTPRDSLNALAKLRGSVTNERTQEKLFSRLQGAHREDLAGQLFTTDAQGQHRLRNQDAVGLMSSLVSGFGGDANAVTNLLGAGGSAAPMVLDAQQRRLITAMASQTQGGGTIAENVARMQRVGSQFGEGDVARGAAMVEAERNTALTSAREAGDNALTDNTKEMNNLSNSIRDWSVRNPLGTVAAGAAAPVVGGLAAKGLGALVATAAGTVGLAGTAALAGVAGQGRTAITGRTLAGNEANTGDRLIAGATALANPMGALASTAGDATLAGIRMIVAELRSNPLRAEVAPVAAAQSASRQPPASR